MSWNSVPRDVDSLNALESLACLRSPVSSSCFWVMGMVVVVVLLLFLAAVLRPGGEQRQGNQPPL